VKVRLNQLEKEIHQILFKHLCIFVQIVCSQVFLLYFFLNVWVIFLLGEQIWHFSDSENIIDIIYEGLIDNLIIREQEDSALILKASFFTPSLNIFSEFFQPIVFRYFNLP